MSNLGRYFAVLSSFTTVPPFFSKFQDCIKLANREINEQ